LRSITILNSTKLFVAAAIAAAIAWVICAAFVMFLPSPMLTLSGQMVHADFEGMAWSITATGLFVGLVAWSVLTGAFAWLIATIYNKLAF
jgi:uncharacterized protein DUF5676